MFKNLSKILFLLMVWLSTFLMISANSWLGIWMGLEINLLAFIPLLVNKNNLNNSEAALNYFLIQAFASAIIIFFMILSMNLFKINFSNFFFQMNIPMKFILLTLMLKLGVPPFHFWFPNVMDNINWMNGLMLMTWQKLGPLMISSYFLKMDLIIISLIIMSTFIGSFGGLNQVSLRKLMAFSSINHLGWMLAAMMYNENMWLFYFSIYSLMNMSVIFMFKLYQIFYLNQTYAIFINSPLLKFSLLLSLMSLGGLPPFLGFVPKWFIIQSLNFMNMNFMCMFMIMMSLITLYYYLKISLAALLMNYNQMNHMYINLFVDIKFMFMLMINLINLFGLFIVIELLYLN